MTRSSTDLNDLGPMAGNIFEQQIELVE